MIPTIYVVMDLNDGVPLIAFQTHEQAVMYRCEADEQYPETKIVEIDLV